jgi:hypothetical protein
MKTNTLLVGSVVVLVAIIIYLLFNSSTKTTVSREYVPVVYTDRRPRERILLGSWGDWEFPTITWIHPPRGQHRPPSTPVEPSLPSTPVEPSPPSIPSTPPVEPAPPSPPAAFVDMSKNVEGFFSPASYPFA